MSHGADYDAPRVTESDADESLEDLTSRRKNDAATAVIDVDDGDAADSFDLPDADLTARNSRSAWFPSRPTNSSLQLLPGATPQSVGAAQGRPAVLHRVC